MAEGNYQGVDKLINGMVEQRVAPFQAEIAKRSAVERAEAEMPYLKNPEVVAYVGRAFQANKDIAELGARENFKYAPLVLKALGQEHELLTARQRIAGFDEEKKTAQREAIDAYKRKVQGLPTTTTATSRPSWPAARLTCVTAVLHAGFVCCKITTFIMSSRIISISIIRDTRRSRVLRCMPLGFCQWLSSFASIFSKAI
jgi:hypothetical protein